MTGVLSSALSRSALSWCCHEIKTLIHLRGPHRPALLLCLDIGIRRGRTRLCRSFFQERARQSLCRQLRRSHDWRRLYFSQARPSRRLKLRSTSCPRHHQSPAHKRVYQKSRSTNADASTYRKFFSGIERRHKITGRFCLPSGGFVRRHSERLCPCTAPAGNSGERPLRLGPRPSCLRLES